MTVNAHVTIQGHPNLPDCFWMSNTSSFINQPLDAGSDNSCSIHLDDRFVIAWSRSRTHFDTRHGLRSSTQNDTYPICFIFQKQKPLRLRLGTSGANQPLGTEGQRTKPMPKTFKKPRPFDSNAQKVTLTYVNEES